MNTDQQKSSMTAWERWELASFDLAEKPVVVTDLKQDVEQPVYSPEQIEGLRAAAQREGEAAGRTAGYEAGFAEGRGAGYEAGHAEGHAVGHAEGHDKGEESAEAAGREAAEELLQLSQKLDARINELGPAVANELLALSLCVAQQVIRQTIKHRPEVVLGVIREALTQLPLQQAAIHLHPEDAALVRRMAGEEIAHASHRIREDPKLERGDVVIESGGSHLDASLANRWTRVLATLGQDQVWIETNEPS